MDNLACTYRHQGRLDTAEELGVQVIEISRKKLGADHPNTLCTMNNLAFTWKAQGRDTEALQLMRECVQFRRRKLGVSHPHYIISLKALGEWEAEQAEDGREGGATNEGSEDRCEDVAPDEESEDRSEAIATDEAEYSSEAIATDEESEDGSEGGIMILRDVRIFSDSEASIQLSESEAEAAPTT